MCKPATENELSVYQQLKVQRPKLLKFVPLFHGQWSLREEKLGELSQKLYSESKESEQSNEKCTVCVCSKRKRETNSSSDSEQSIKRTKSCKARSGSYEELVEQFKKRRRKIMKTSANSDDGKEDLIFLVLEDVTNNHKKPHVLDLKVGTQQHGTHESEAKIKSKTFKCKTTTSATLGLRVGGMQYFDKQGHLIVRGKKWGRQLKDHHLKEAVQQFVSESPRSPALPDVSQDMDYSSESEEAIPSDTDIEPAPARKTIVNSVVEQLDDLIEAVKEVEWRFYGCSALVAFDANDCSTPSVKLIDFANAELSGHQGFDEGFVFGLQNLRNIFQQTLSSTA